MRFLVNQHAACEPPGGYETELRARGIAFECAHLDQGQPMPDWRAFDAILVMGGPMGAGEEERLPWLAREKRELTDALQAGMLCWGVCLGAQLLAACLGAPVYRGERAEIGVYADVELTPEARHDPVFERAPSPRCSGTPTRSLCPRARDCWRAPPHTPTKRLSGEEPTGCNFISRPRPSWPPRGSRYPPTPPERGTRLARER
jgi:GMP synthase-like glutamine amidotransferase